MSALTVELLAPPEMGPHINKVMCGEYDIPLELESPRILDIGANVGAFSIWAATRWPGASIYAYEPNKSNFAFLEKNIDAHAGIAKQWELHEAAVGRDPGIAKLYDGKNNCGECSLYRREEQLDSFTEVNVIGAEQLPKADIIKIDAEGAELEILLGLTNPSINTSRAIMLEYHSDEDCNYLLKLFYPTYRIHAVIPSRRDRGILKLIKK